MADRPRCGVLSGLREAPPWLWAAALAPRLALGIVAVIHPDRCVRGDSLGHLQLARNMLSRHVFAVGDTGPFSPNTFRTPGYPLFLIPFVSLPRAVVAAAIAQCLLGALTTILAWTWFRRFAGRRGAAVGALALAFDPVTLLHTPLIMSETLFSLLLTLAAAHLWITAEQDESGPVQAAANGFLWSAAALVKPLSVYLPVFLCWRWRKNRRAVAAFLLGAYCLPAAWTARNWARTGYAVFSSVGSQDLLRYPAAGVESLRTGRPWQDLDPELRARVDSAHPGGYASDAQQASEYAKEAGTILEAHPGLLARYCAWGTVKILAGTGLEMLLEWTTDARTAPADQQFRPQATGQGTLALLRAHPMLIPVEILYVLGLATLYVLAFAGLRGYFSRGRTAYALFLALCLAYFLGLSSSEGYYRYRIPLMPFLSAAAAGNFP